MRNRNALPALDLLVGFEAAARHLSFTKAGEELFLTQSAVSRQIKELEEQLGVELFQRRHRALALTGAGKSFYASAAQVLTTMRAATEQLRTQAGKKGLSVTTTNSFAALWLIPRLAGFTRTHPGVDVRIMAETRVQDLDRDGLDVAVRHGPASLAGSNAVRLMGERVFPVCSPKLLKDKSKPLREPQDLRYHCLLQYDDPEGRHPWLHWKTWLEVERIADLRPAGTLSFSGYEQIIPAAIAGHGVALGRSPLVKDLIASGELVAPFKSSADPSRAYYAVVSKSAEGRPEVAEFVVWLRQEAGKR
ncbi:MAG TPA: transcriptional regulator GcvA [Burkholderiales bacterium]|jgi:LysR family glycine cleavage system transcriptional activator|nr:transcriptional regulator GcvA [Burkholderiales bacterium]